MAARGANDDRRYDLIKEFALERLLEEAYTSDFFTKSYFGELVDAVVVRKVEQLSEHPYEGDTPGQPVHNSHAVGNNQDD
jgi:hypothetical protein